METSSSRPKPLVLLILDGVGVAPPSQGNAWTQAKTPHLDELMESFFVTTLQASSEAVGLPFGEMGNSEVGHTCIGTGRILYQNLPRISRAITDGSFMTNPAFMHAAEHVKKTGGTLHILGMFSSGGVHSYHEHGYALLEFAKQHNITNVVVHCILDGRDVPYNSGAQAVEQLEKTIQRIGVGKIATVMGRLYAMDRDHHWERTQKAYNAMVAHKGLSFASASEAIADSYGHGVYDEELVPAVIGDAPPMTGNDAIIFFNFRPDRTRQLTEALAMLEFVGFERTTDTKGLVVVTMTQYENNLPVAVAFPPEAMPHPLAEALSVAGLKQLHIAETEKYAHVTFFFNGGCEAPFEREDREIIPSPRVASYAEVPAMSVETITKRIHQEIDRCLYDVIVANFANGDMVAHTGDLGATVKAFEIMDRSIGSITERVLQKNGVLIITADHGNAEELVKPSSGIIDKEHSTNPVPFIVVGKEWSHDSQPIDLAGMTPSGILSDIAPTVLDILHIQKPPEMTGVSLIEKDSKTSA